MQSHGGGSGAGVTGVLTNLEVYKWWPLAMHQRSTATEHHASIPSEILKSKEMVSNDMAAVESYLSPF